MDRFRDLPTITQADINNPASLAMKLAALVENVRILCGTAGPASMHAVNRTGLQGIGLVDSDGNPTGAGGSGDIDLTPPPTPTGLAAGGGLTHLFVSWDAPTYTQGHGNGQTNIYGAKYPGTGALPTFADAVLIDSEVFGTDIAAIPSEPNTEWHVWAKFQSRDGVESVAPAGGTNGVVAHTGVDVKNLLDTLTNAALSPTSPYSRILFRADLFAVGPELEFNQEATPTGTAVGQLWYKPSTGVTQSWSGAAWTPFSVPLPFIINTRPTVINGVTIPAGVYMDSAFIYDLTAAVARMGIAWIDSAMIASLSASKLTAGSINVGAYIQSTGYTGSGHNEWRIDGNGTARFYDCIVYGTVYANAGSIGGISIYSNAIESSNYNGTSAGFRLDGTLGKLFAYSGEFGGTLAVKSAASGQRTEITNAGIKVFNSAGTEVITLGVF
jgi:hypothetical protein